MFGLWEKDDGIRVRTKIKWTRLISMKISPFQVIVSEAIYLSALNLVVCLLAYRVVPIDIQFMDINTDQELILHGAELSTDST